MAGHQPDTGWSCGADWDTGQEALQRAYALRDRDTGRIRLTERLSVRH